MNHTNSSVPGAPVVERIHLVSFVLITSMFFAWGLANNMTDTLLAAFKRILSMSDSRTAFVQYAFYGAYFCFALPAAVFIQRYSYKTGLLLGLGLFIAGSLMFYPASQTMLYWHFLIALYVLASGLAFLETAANPYIFSMGAPGTATQRLNLAQSFNPIGSIAGVFLSQFFILGNLDAADAAARSTMAVEQLEAIQQQELNAVMGPYVGVAGVLLALWVIMALKKMPTGSDGNERPPLADSIRRLVRLPNYRWSVIAQFFFVGAQIGVWSFTIRYVMSELGLNESQAANYYLTALFLFLIFRFVCTWLMGFVRPEKLLGILALVAIGLSLFVASVGGSAGCIALVILSACMSLMFPTIYGLGLRGLGADTKIGGAGLIMAILGGALITGAQAYVSDSFASIRLAYVVPAVCFGFVTYYALFVAPRFESARL